MELPIVLVDVDDRFVWKQETHLTILKTSLFFSGDGFTAYNSQGNLVFRVDSYTRDQPQVVLMDASGSCLLTLRKRRRSLHHRWEGYRGEGTQLGSKPIFSARKSSIIGSNRCAVEVEVYSHDRDMMGAILHNYIIEGCFANRHSTIHDGAAGGTPVVEIRRKVDVSTNMVLGRDVFSLCVKPGFDGAFAMALILVLDQINLSSSKYHSLFSN